VGAVAAGSDPAGGLAAAAVAVAGAAVLAARAPRAMDEPGVG
jgi:hypothetical protein